jgi:hypothetical protein
MFRSNRKDLMKVVIKIFARFLCLVEVKRYCNINLRSCFTNPFVIFIKRAGCKFAGEKIFKGVSKM